MNWYVIRKKNIFFLLILLVMFRVINGCFGLEVAGAGVLVFVLWLKDEER